MWPPFAQKIKRQIKSAQMQRMYSYASPSPKIYSHFRVNGSKIQMLLTHNNGLLSNCHFILNMHFRHVENCHSPTELGVDLVIVTHIPISTNSQEPSPCRMLSNPRSHTFRELCVSAFPTHIPKAAGLFCAYFTQQTPFL